VKNENRNGALVHWCTVRYTEKVDSSYWNRWHLSWKGWRYSCRFLFIFV